MFHFRRKTKKTNTAHETVANETFERCIDRAIADSGMNKVGDCDVNQNNLVNAIFTIHRRQVCRLVLLGVFAIASIAFFLDGYSTGKYRTFTFLAVMTLGLASNALVVMANGGKMPARTDLYRLSEELQARYTSIGPDTRFRLLADCIPVGRHLASLGDILILVGALAWWSQRFY